MIETKKNSNELWDIVIDIDDIDEKPKNAHSK